MGAFGSCLGVGRPVRPGANPRFLGSNLVNVEASPFGPPSSSRQNARRTNSYITNGSSLATNGRAGPMPKLMRQSSALSSSNQQKAPLPTHLSSPSSQNVQKLVDFDDNVPLQNSHSNCNKRQATTTSIDDDTFLKDIRLNQAEYRILLALHDYESRTPEDLGFRKGDHLETTKSYMQGDWWLARSKSTKEIGHIPSNYVTELKMVGAEHWFFGNLGRAEAEMRLKHKDNENGAFIIRNSDTGGPHLFSLSLKHNDIVKHYKIIPYEKGGFFITPKTVFSTIHDLVLHYSKNADGLCINLRKPCTVGPAPTTMGLSYDTHDEWEIDRKRLTVLSELGRGQFGQVYKGLFNNVQPVAIKTLRKGSMDPQDFLAEAQIMKKMRHANLVRLFAVCTQEEPVYIVTELMSNGALIDYLKKEEGQKLALSDYINMATQIASGMAYLERERYVHRDLAARNILVGEQNICKIADFGLARFIKETEYEARAGARFPIKWTAPEAANYSKFTIKSDVWSFGIVLYEIITKGGTPYPDMSNAEVLNRIEKGYRMPQPPSCDPKYYSIMMSCWNKDPLRRPAFETLSWELGDYFSSDEQYREPSQFMVENK